jgi:hypothetical protein
MGHGSRHAPHGGQLFGAQAGLHLPQVVQKHHAQAFFFGDGVFLVGGCQPGLRVQAHGALALGQQVDVGHLRLSLAETPARQQHQGVPVTVLQEAERRLHMGGTAEKCQCGRVGHAHRERLVHDEHAVVQVLDHQAADLSLHLCRHAVGVGQALLAHQARGQLVREKGHDEVACSSECRLEIVWCGVAPGGGGAHPGRPAQQQQAWRLPSCPEPGSACPALPPSGWAGRTAACNSCRRLQQCLQGCNHRQIHADGG